MPKLPEPKTPLQARAYAMLLAVQSCNLTRTQMDAMNVGMAMNDTKKCLRFLRDHRLIHITEYTAGDHPEPVYKAGYQRDAPMRKRPFGTKVIEKANAVIPQRDPLMAALFGAAPTSV